MFAWHGAGRLHILFPEKTLKGFEQSSVEYTLPAHTFVSYIS